MKKVFTENKNNMFIRSSTSGNRSLRLREEGYFRSDGGCVCVSVWGEGGQQVLNEEQQKKRSTGQGGFPFTPSRSLHSKPNTTHTQTGRGNTVCVCVCVCPGECNTVPIFRMLDVTTAYKGHHERVRSWSEVMLVNSNPFFIFIKKAQVWVFQFSSEFKIRLFFKQQQ